MAFLLLVAIVVIVVLAHRLSRAGSPADKEQLAQGQQYGMWAAARIQQLEIQLRKTEEAHATALVQRASRAVAASRGTYDGHVAEQFFPAAQHAYHPKDVFHLGGVLDYIVFDGLYEVRNGERDPATLNVVLVDVKWGNSRASDTQKAVLSAVAEGRARAEVWQARASLSGELLYDRKTS